MVWHQPKQHSNFQEEIPQELQEITNYQLPIAIHVSIGWSYFNWVILWSLFNPAKMISSPTGFLGSHGLCWWIPAL